MKKPLKYIIAAAAVAAVAVLAVGLARKAGGRAESREMVSLVVKNREKLAELVTYRYSRDTVIYETRERSGLVAFLEGSTDTVAVLLVRPTVCAGVDLRHLKSEDFRIGRDTIYVTLPPPQILEVYVNHADIRRIYTARDWRIDNRLGQITEKAKASFRDDAVNRGVLLKAGARAERSMSEFLTLMCGKPVVATCSAPLPSGYAPATH